MASKFVSWMAYFGLVLLARTSISHVTGNIMTNELADSTFEDETLNELPVCRPGSACGYLQVNAFGINKEQFCRCPSLSVICPLHWDPQDGHSVTMVSQQYKYCGRAPSVRTCNRIEPAYTSAFLFDQSTFDVMGVIHTIHCLCPPPRFHIMEGSVEDAMENMLMIGSIHKCDVLPQCDVDSGCKELSFSGTSSLVTEKCRCRRGLACPTLSYDVTANDMNSNFMNGKAYSVHCQPLF